MQVIVSTRHADVGDPLRRFIEEQVSRLERFEPRIQRVEVTLLEEKKRRVVEVQLSVDRAAPIHAHAEADEFRTAVDRAIDKLARQLKKSRGRRRERKSPGVDLELDRTA